MNILLKSAKIIDANSSYHKQIKDILINNGVIKKIGDNLKKPTNCKAILLDNLHVSTGWFDTSVSLGEPGYEERETIENGLQVAAKSGFTAVAVNPNTNPIIDSKAGIEFLINKAKNNLVSLYPIGALTQKSEGIELAELFDMQNSGAIAFGDYNKAIENTNLLKIALQYSQSFDGIILSYPQTNKITNEGLINEGINSTYTGLKGNPALSEELQIARDLFILEYTGGKLHIPTISTSKSVKLIKEAKQKGLDITCSVSAHHLVLTDNEILSYDSNYKVNPPLRTKEDTKALIKGIKDGVIDMIVSDHNPIEIEHKKVEFINAKSGTIGLESLFGATNRIIELEKLINCLTIKPRKRFKLNIQTINEGENTELTLFNPIPNWIFTKENISSSSKNAIFINKQMKGKVYGTFAKNQLTLN